MGVLLCDYLKSWRFEFCTGVRAHKHEELIWGHRAVTVSGDSDKWEWRSSWSSDSLCVSVTVCVKQVWRADLSPANNPVLDRHTNKQLGNKWKIPHHTHSLMLQAAGISIRGLPVHVNEVKTAINKNKTWFHLLKLSWKRERTNKGISGNTIMGEWHTERYSMVWTKAA